MKNPHTPHTPPKRKMSVKVQNRADLPKASWQELDKEIAEQMLGKLEPNRRLISNHVQFLAREMSEGRWQVNGDTIRFSGDRLLDGQHRLHALIQADIKIWALVVEEIPQTAFSTIDTGRMRGAGDVLSIAGYRTSPFLMAAVCRFLWYYDHGFPLETSLRVSNEEILTTAKNNPSIQFFAEYMLKYKNMCYSTTVTAMVMISRKVGRKTAVEFAEKFLTGAELGLNDPIRFFREKWFEHSSHRGARGERAAWIATTIKTFNLWITHTSVKQVASYRPTEKFPVVLRLGDTLAPEDQ